jgi:hypothetical protein
VAAGAADHKGETDIVERALAIVDEESRAWALRRRGLLSPAETAPPSDEQPGDDR